MSKKNRPRDKRSKDNLPSFRLTERDTEIIKAINDCQALLTQQVQTAFFNSATPTYTRLQKLYHHHYLERHFITQVSAAPAASIIIYTIAQLGAAVLAANFGYSTGDFNFATKQVLDWKTLQHLIDHNTFRIAVLRACRDTPIITLTDWLNERYFRADPDYVHVTPARGNPQNKPLFPDGFMILTSPHGKANFFVETDRGTEPLSQVKSQIEIYQEYLTSGRYQQKFQSRAVRVLMITNSQTRINNIKKVISQCGGGSRYWLTNRDQITPETVLSAPIWEVVGKRELQPLIPPIQ
jgi:hypothetical protein